MAIRNFRQEGQAYGSATAEVVVALDGVQIYSGPLTTVSGPLPPQPGVDIDNLMATWQLPADFQGIKVLTIQVSNSPMYLADTTADRTLPSDVSAQAPIPYTQNINGVEVQDPLTNVSINGQSVSRSSELPGQWYWIILPGQTFQATVNIPAGIDYPDWSADLEYPSHANVIYNNVVYNSGISTVPAGTVPSENPLYWFTVPTPVWDINSSYAIYSRVSTGTPISYYMAIQNVPAGIPITDKNYWELRV